MKDGYLKFNCNLIYRESPKYIEELKFWRNKFHCLNLIGEYKKIGFGNISLRNENGFIITGSRTGGIEKLFEDKYVKVTEWDFEKNNLTCVGKIPASSESLTHAAIYDADKKINGIIHIHNFNLWKRLINKIPTTSSKAQYGTFEMVQEIFRLYSETDVIEKKILAMAGHKDGIISFGESVTEAAEILLKYF